MQNKSVHGAVTLNALYYSMASLVTFTPGSIQAVSHLPVTRFGNSEAFYITSRLLNRQVKVAFYHLLKAAQKDVLKDFERELRTRSRTAWPTAFCIALLLCMCVEDIQIAADYYVTYKEDGETCDRKDSHKICNELETLPYGRCTSMFHEVFATFKSPNGHGGEGSFNPFKQGQFSRDELDGAAQTLVSEIQDIFKNHCKLPYSEPKCTLTKPRWRDDANYKQPNF